MNSLAQEVNLKIPYDYNRKKVIALVSQEIPDRHKPYLIITYSTMSSLSNPAISQHLRLISIPTTFFVLVEVGVFCTVLGRRTVLLFDARGAIGAACALPTSRQFCGAVIR